MLPAHTQKNVFVCFFLITSGSDSAQQELCQCDHRTPRGGVNKIYKALLLRERYPNICEPGPCEPRDRESALHPITHIQARSTIDQTVINSHLSPTHCFPSCSKRLPLVPASTHGNPVYIKVCSWTRLGSKKMHKYKTLCNKKHAAAHNDGGPRDFRVRCTQML